MRKFWLFLFFTLFLSLTGCETPYAPQGLMGGYTTQMLDNNTALVSFNGNAYTSKTRVATFLLYRCAETALERGYDYFIIVSSNADVKHWQYTTPATYHSNTFSNAYAHGYGNTVTAYGSSTTTGTYYPGSTYHWQKHKVTAIIKMFKGAKPPQSLQAFNAHELVRNLKPSVYKQQWN